MSQPEQEIKLVAYWIICVQIYPCNSNDYGSNF